MWRLLPLTSPCHPMSARWLMASHQVSKSCNKSSSHNSSSCAAAKMCRRANPPRNGGQSAEENGFVCVCVSVSVSTGLASDLVEDLDHGESSKYGLVDDLRFQQTSRSTACNTSPCNDQQRLSSLSSPMPFSAVPTCSTFVARPGGHGRKCSGAMGRQAPSAPVWVIDTSFPRSKKITNTARLYAAGD